MLLDLYSKAMTMLSYYAPIFLRIAHGIQDSSGRAGADRKWISLYVAGWRGDGMRAHRVVGPVPFPLGTI